jgi:hypothetical protein
MVSSATSAGGANGEGFLDGRGYLLGDAELTFSASWAPLPCVVTYCHGWHCGPPSLLASLLA